MKPVAGQALEAIWKWISSEDRFKVHQPQVQLSSLNAHPSGQVTQHAPLGSAFAVITLSPYHVSDYFLTTATDRCTI